jgi:O-antigen ligase
MNTTIVTTKPNFLNRPVIIAIIIGIIVILWSLMRDYLTVLVLLGIAALFIIGMKKPLWAMAALIISQLSLTSYMVNLSFVVISLRLLLSLVAILIMAKALIRREVNLGPGARRLLIPMLLLIGVSVVANLFNVGFDTAFKDFRVMLVGLLFAILLPAMVNNTKQLKTLCVVICIVITASAVIGIMQRYNVLGMASATMFPGFINLTNTSDVRVPGIAETELELAYVLAATMVIILSLFITKGVNSNKKSLIISIILMLIALYFTYTRSALFALLLGLVSLAIFVRSRVRWEIFLIPLFILIFFIVQTDILGNTYFSGRSETNQMESSISRSIVWQAGVGIALSNPILGIGADQFVKVSPKYQTSVDQKLIQWEEDRYWSWRTLGTTEPHNDFLNIWLSYGTIALALYIWLHFAIMRNFFESFRASKRRFIKGISLGLAGALVTYVANSFYHNISNTLPLLWILAGLSLAVLKLTIEKKTARKENAPTR